MFKVGVQKPEHSQEYSKKKLDVDFCRRNDLIIGNTKWEQTTEEKHTFVASQKNSKSLIDGIYARLNINNRRNWNKKITRDRN